MIEPSKQREIERLTDLTKAVIGELPITVVEVAQLGTEFLFWLEHVTDGACGFTLPVQVIHISDGAVGILIDREIERILDEFWGRSAGASG